MSIWPESPEEFAMLDPPANRRMQLQPVFTGDMFKQAVAYPVLVEGWDKKKSGRVKRAWLKEFTEAERTTISSYYKRFYRWHLVTGMPAHVSCRLTTLALLQRAVNFFASI
jgi:hypothetical protein